MIVPLAGLNLFSAEDEITARVSSYAAAGQPETVADNGRYGDPRLSSLVGNAIR